MTGYTAGFQEVMSKRMQRVHHKVDVFRAIANFEERSNLVKGDTVHRLKKTIPSVQSYTRGTSMTIGVHTEVDENLVVSTAKVAPFYVDDLDQLQFNFKYQAEFGADMATRLGNFIDGDVLAQVTNAATTPFSNLIDDLVINPQTGTSGNGVFVSANNIQRVFSTAQRKITKQRGPMANRFVVLSPEFYQALIDYLAGKNTPLADKIGPNGDVGASYYGFQLYLSNACLFTATINIATTPTANDTVTINGNTFTFVSSIGTTAGNVLFTTAANANTNLAALINAPSTTTSNGVAFAATTDTGNGINAVDALTGISAVAAATSTAITSKGNGAIAVSSVLTAQADGWNANTQIEHIMFGIKGSIDVVIQAEPKIEVKEVPDKLGKNIIPWTLYGIKTFREGTLWIVDFKRNTSQD